MIDPWTDTISIQSQLRDIHEAIKAELPAITRTTDRCYKAAWSNDDDAFRLMGELSGSRFDPECVAALLANRATIEAIQDQFRASNPFHEGYMIGL